MAGDWEVAENETDAVAILLIQFVNLRHDGRTARALQIGIFYQDNLGIFGATIMVANVTVVLTCLNALSGIITVSIYTRIKGCPNC